jgi:hypothetical protein
MKHDTTWRVLFVMSVTGAALFIFSVYELVQAQQLVASLNAAPSNFRNVVVNGTTFTYSGSYTLNVLKWSGFPLMLGSAVFTLASFFGIPHDDDHSKCAFCGTPYKEADKKERMYLVTHPKRFKRKEFYFCSKEHMAEWMKK